jgi:hypothetical protein
MAQTAAEDRCNPVMSITTEAACRSHATKTGRVFGRVGNWGAPYHGCFYLQSQVLFGRGGSIAQMSKQMPPDYPYDRFRQNEDGVGNVDPSCLLLSNQAKLESNQANLASMLKMLLLLADPACSDFSKYSSKHSKSDCPRENGCSIGVGVDYAGAEATAEAGVDYAGRRLKGLPEVIVDYARTSCVGTWQPN